MFTICIHTIVLKLSSLVKEERKKKKEDEQKQVLHVVFSNGIKVSGTFTVDLAIEKPRDVVYKYFAFVCFVFHGAAPIPYVQAGILKPGRSLSKEYYCTP